MGGEMSRTKRIAVAVALGALLLPVLSWMALGPGDNALRNAHVGDWVEFAMHTGAMGQQMEMKTKQTVVAKDAAFVTLRTETSMMGHTMPPQDVKIPLNTAYEPYATGLTDAKITILGQGNETLTVGGKAYACHWMKVRVTATKPQPMEGTTKVWTSPSVPVSGVVKMETESTVTVGGKPMRTQMTMELVGSGR